MDQRTSPTCRSCRQYWNNLPAHRKREILSRGQWTTFTSLINLPPTHRRGGRHHLSDNEGDDEADDADVGEDSVSDDGRRQQRLWHNEGDIANYDSDHHLIIDNFHPYDEVDKEDEDDEDSDIDEDDDEDSDIDEDDDNEDEDEDEDKDDNEDEDEDDQDVDKDEDVFLNSDEIYSASTVSFCDLNHEDDHSSLSSIEEDHSDHSSVSSIDFDRFDFAPILADLELICQNGYLRNPRTGSYHSVNSSWRFTESQIRAAVRNFPDTFLREYFFGGTFPNFH